MSNKEHLVSALTNDELACLVSATAAYINQLKKFNRDTRIATDTLHKVIDAYTMSNYLNAVEIDGVRTKRMGCAEGKEYLASI